MCGDALKMYFFAFIFIFFIDNAFCLFKVFLYHSDISDSSLWVGHQKSKDCSGVIFTKDFHSVYINKQLKAAQVLLPQHGSIYIINGGYLEINADLSDSCIQIDEIPLQSYYNPNSWALNNPSVPSIERIPCAHDEVMFPFSLNSPIVFDDKIDLKMRHMVMDDTVIEDDYLFDHFLQIGEWPVTAYAKPEVHFTKIPCEDESGCVCHGRIEQEGVCRYIRGLSGGDGSGGGGCLQAIEPPIGECSVSSFCGGVLHMKPQSGFKLKKLQKLLEDYDLSVDTVGAYASKVAPDVQTRLIQVVFAETKYTGRSADVAKEFFKRLTGHMMEDLQIADVKLYASGAALVEGQTGAAVVGMIFGSLFAVAVVFAAIYVYYVGPLKNYNFSKSLPSRSLTKTFGGVRYKSKDEEQLVYEGQSIAGSILSLDRAFDNPMYGQQTSASTSTGETTVIQEQKLQENPMYKADLDKIENVDSEI